MNKYLKTSLVLLSSIFVLAACGQNNSAGNAAETTQNAQETTQANTMQSMFSSVYSFWYNPSSKSLTIYCLT